MLRVRKGTGAELVRIKRSNVFFRVQVNGHVLIINGRAVWLYEYPWSFCPYGNTENFKPLPKLIELKSSAGFGCHVLISGVHCRLQFERAEARGTWGNHSGTHEPSISGWAFSKEDR